MVCYLDVATEAFSHLGVLLAVFLSKLKNISGSNIAFAFGLCMVLKHFSFCIACLQLMLCPWRFLVEKVFPVEKPYV